MSDALAAWWGFMAGLDDVTVLGMAWRGTVADGFTIGSQQPDTCTWMTNNRWCHMCWLGQTVVAVVRLTERVPTGAVHITNVATSGWKAIDGMGAQAGHTFIGRKYRSISWANIRTIHAIAKSPAIVTADHSLPFAQQRPRPRIEWLYVTIRSVACFAPRPPGSVGPLI